MLGKLMQRMEDDRLHRLADANGKWCAASYGTFGSDRCFIGHAYGTAPSGMSKWEDRFDKLCGRNPRRVLRAHYGVPVIGSWNTRFRLLRSNEARVIGRLIEKRARRILADRKIKAMEKVETRQLVEV